MTILKIMPFQALFIHKVFKAFSDKLNRRGEKPQRLLFLKAEIFSFWLVGNMIFHLQTISQIETLLLDSQVNNETVQNCVFHMGGNSTHELSLNCWCQPIWGYDLHSGNQLIEHQNPSLS